MDFEMLPLKDECWYKSVCKTSLDSECDNDMYCVRYHKMDSLVQRACMVGKQRYTIQLYPDTRDVDAYKRLKGIKDNISDFVSNGSNLLIYSKNTGNGKTEWSKKLLLSWFGSIWHTTDFECRGLFISMPRLMQAMKEDISKPNDYYRYVVENIPTADLIVWDEINYKEWSPYEEERMLDWISQRVSIGKSNIYTTNYDLPTIEKKLGNRLASRVVGQSEKVELVGADKRGVSNG